MQLIPRASCHGLDFVDSELARAAMAGPDLVLTFSAAAVRQADGTRGYLSALAMTFHAAHCTGDLAGCVGRIADASLQGADVARGALPLPFATAHPVHAHLRFANGTALEVRAGGMGCTPDGSGRFVESYAC